MPKLRSGRVLLALFAIGCFLVFLPCLRAQEDPNDLPLGDVARSFRRKVAPPEVVIDNDNFSKVVEEAESHRSAGTTMTFTLDPGAKNFHVSTPDASCTLTFTAKASALLSDPVMLDELPKDELAKLDGPATIDGDSLQLSIHNGSAWNLREVVIGLTIVRAANANSASSYGTPAYYGSARILPAAAMPYQAQDPGQKLQDTTILLHMKGSASPLATAIFRTQLNFALFPDQEWHWAIVRAKGVPPPPPLSGVELAQPSTVQAAPFPVPSSIQYGQPVGPEQNSTQGAPSSGSTPESPVSNQ